MKNIFILFFGLIFFTSVYAQNQPKETIGIIEEQQKLEEKEKEIKEKISKEKEVPIEETPTIQPSLPKTEPVLIKKIKVEGVTLLKEKEINKIISPYENKKLSLSDMQKIANLITDAYRKKGYTTSRAYLPPQKIEGETLTIRVVEGKVGKIEIKGNRYFKSKAIEKKIKLQPKEYFNYSKLSKSLTYINENPDIFAKAVLSPGEEPQTTDIILDIKDKFPWHIGFEYDNFGSRYIERDRLSLVLENNNLLGFGDKLYFKTQLAEADLYSLKLVRYAFPIDNGFDVGFYFSHSRLFLGREFKELSSVGKASITGIFLNKELISTNNFDIRYNFGFDHKHIRNYYLGKESSRDEVRVLRNGFDIDITDSFGRSVFSPELSFGIPRMFGALTREDPSSSRTGSGGKFVKGTFSLYRLQPMFFSSSILFKSYGQASNYNLVAAEQFSIGGPNSVRGYDPQEYSGDRGFYYSIEWSFPLYFIPKNINVPYTQKKLYDALRIVGFYDYGTVQLNNPSTQEEKGQTLKAFGGGVRFNLKDLSVRFEVGYPIKKPSLSGSRAHRWIEVSLKF